MSAAAAFRRLLLSALLCPLLAVQARPPYTPTAARPASPFILQDPAGHYHRLVDYRGKVLIVNFWASWCAPCREELPSMNRAWKVLENEPVAMLAINVSDDREALEAFLQDYAIDFSVLLDPLGDASRRWQVSGLPTTFVLDRDGRIVHRMVGKRDWDNLDLLQLVRRLSGSEQPVN